MKSSAKYMKQGTYRHYRRLADGTEKYLGEVRYTYPAERADTCRDVCRAQELAWRDLDECERREADCAAFEELVDAACEG